MKMLHPSFYKVNRIISYHEGDEEKYRDIYPRKQAITRVLSHACCVITKMLKTVLL